MFFFIVSDFGAIGVKAYLFCVIMVLGEKLGSATFLDGMRVGDSGFSVLLAGAMNALLSQIAIAAYVRIGKSPTNDNAEGKQDNCCCYYN